MKPFDPWTTNEIKILTQALWDSKDRKDIANTLGRTVRAVHAQTIRLRSIGADLPPVRALPYKLKVTPTTERICLRCNKPFPSTGIGNRICDGHNTRISQHTWLADSYEVDLPRAR